MFKVLIIDDEEVIREGLRSAIEWEEMCCKVVGEAEDGDEGLALINSLEPDIVLTDIRMPGLNGLEMICRINQLKHICKIIILTGFRDFEYAQEAVRLGAFRLLLKPTKKEELMKAIEEALKEIRRLKSEQILLKNLQRKVNEQYGLNEGNILSEEYSLKDEKKNSTYLVNKALSYMKANYAEDLSLKNIADELYISTWYISKLLRKETGRTFIDILNEIRIQEAKKLLHEPKYKIYEVANRVGFTDVPYFTKLFKRIIGLTPMEFRNKLNS